MVYFQVLWTKLLKLNQRIWKICIPERDICNLECQSREWVPKIYQTEAITQYIHAMSNQAGEFMRIHSSIIPFI